MCDIYTMIREKFCFHAEEVGKSIFQHESFVKWFFKGIKIY